MNSCLLVGLLAANVVAAGPPRHARYPKWITSYEAARAAATKEGKPMLVVLRCEP